MLSRDQIERPALDQRSQSGHAAEDLGEAVRLCHGLEKGQHQACGAFGRDGLAEALVQEVEHYRHRFRHVFLQRGQQGPGIDLDVLDRRDRVAGAPFGPGDAEPLRPDLCYVVEAQ